ncbi:MAG: hypothetical protein ABIK65_12285 [Candidatus Eisenbacteria bacterium]
MARSPRRITAAIADTLPGWVGPIAAYPFRGGGPMNRLERLRRIVDWFERYL